MNASEELHAAGLAQQLLEARATIDALLAGQIDAIVDDASGTPVLLAKAQESLKQREETLRTSEERMRFALETADIGLWDLDCASGALTWSATLEAQYGLEPGTFAGTFDAYVQLIHPDDRASVLAAVAAAMQSGVDYSAPNRTLWKDGSVQWLSGAGRFVLGEDGRAIRGAGISQNITERRTLERQYQHAQKMEAIGLLASGVAHDFNNLLTVIHGFASLVAEDAALDPRHACDLDEVLKAADRAAALTKQLLAFSRQQVLQTLPLDVNLLLRDMTGMLGRLIGENIEVSLVLEPGLSLALADRGQLEQVVMNLVVNARDAMPDGGRVTIETKDFEFDESFSRLEAVTPGLYVMVSITDTGCGMTEATKQHLFEPFFTTKESGKGTGLGLSTTYGIVKQSKGYIWVDSELGRGTTFRVYFPRADREATADAVRPEVAARLERRSRTVLLVEDESGLRMLVKRMLESEGFRVLDAANGDDAEMLFAEHADSIDLLLTDVVMPGCGGPELLTRLQGRSPALNVLYMSGYTEQSAAHKAGIDRGTPFLQKPFTAPELLRQVRRALPIDR